MCRFTTSSRNGSAWRSFRKAWRGPSRLPFGFWSLPDRSTPGKKWIEEQLDQAITFYQGQIEQRRWYGFWDYGDVMHSYDLARHAWRSDVGGFAWANGELRNGD